MTIAIIDSGVNGAVFKDYNIKQYYIQNRTVMEEPVGDRLGHGTSMLGIILRQQNTPVSVLSLRPVICDNIIDNNDIATAIRFAVDKGAGVISISMGNNLLKERKSIEDACEYAYKNRVSVVCAFSKRNDVILPWACKYAVKVMHGDERNHPVQFKRAYFDSYMICVNKPMYRTVDICGTRKMIVGHSAATAYIVGKMVQYMNRHMCDSIEALHFFFLECGISCNKNQLYNKVETIKGRISYLDKEEEINWGAAAVIPYSKEMESLIRFQDFGSYYIKVGVDYGKKGIRKVADQEETLPIETSLERLERYDLDTVFVGYLNKLENYSDIWGMDNVLRFALSHNYNVFSFLPVSTDFKMQFREKRLRLQEANIYDVDYLRQIKEIVPYSFLCRLPVLGVFGTSSKQGKFTLQMLIRRELKRRGIRHISLLTEHQAELLNASVCFPSGYKGENNIRLSIEEQIEVLQKSLYYLEQTTDAEMILAGGQSWLIPHDIDRQIAIYNLAFIEAVRPDYSVVVVNPEIDHIDYIRDTISGLKAIYKTRTIAVAFSDKKVVLCGRSVLRQPRDAKNIIEVSNYLQQETGIYAGCITRGDFVNKIIDFFIDLSS